MRTNDLMLLSYPGDGTKRENAHTISTGNILQQGACSGNTKGNCTKVPGNFTNNAVGSVQKLLRDPDDLDYRPKQASDLVAKGIWSYRRESIEHGGYYWIPGHQQLVASMPIPTDDTTTAKCESVADLMWLAGYGAQTMSTLVQDKEAVQVEVSKMDAKITYVISQSSRIK